MDPYRLLESPKLLRIMPMDPLILLKSSMFSQKSSNDQNHHKRRTLGRAEIHYWKAKTLKNHEKTHNRRLKQRNEQPLLDLAEQQPRFRRLIAINQVEGTV